MKNGIISIAQWGIDQFGKDFLDTYWDYNKNQKSPWQIVRSSSERIFIYCQNKSYHGSYEISANNFTQGKRCGYCHMFKIHPLDSFAQYNIDHIDINFIKKYWGENNKDNPFKLSPGCATKVWIKCQEKEYHGEYQITCHDFKNGKRCSYCHGTKIHFHDSLGYIHDKADKLWSNKNNKSSYEYKPYSSKNAWWKCENNIHEDYSKIIRNSTRDNFRCPECSRERTESFLQEKTRKYLTEDLGYDLNHEYNCSIIAINPHNGYQLPYDNEVIELNLICEVMGLQHYYSGSNIYSFKKPNMTAEESLLDLQYRDKIKKDFVIESGYHYLAIPYWEDDKNETYKKSIDNKIKEITQIQQKSTSST